MATKWASPKVFKGWVCDGQEVTVFESHHWSEAGANMAVMGHLEERHGHVRESLAEWAEWYANVFQLDGHNFGVEEVEMND